MGANTYEKDGWIVEECEFHPSVWPSQVTYRHKVDGPLQVQSAWDLSLNKDGITYKPFRPLAFKRFIYFVDTCQDFSIEWKDDTLWFYGWSDLTTDDDRRIYENDVRDSM